MPTEIKNLKKTAKRMQELRAEEEMMRHIK